MKNNNNKTSVLKNFTKIKEFKKEIKDFLNPPSISILYHSIHSSIHNLLCENLGKYIQNQYIFLYFKREPYGLETKVPPWPQTHCLSNYRL